MDLFIFILSKRELFLKRDFKNNSKSLFFLVSSSHKLSTKVQKTNLFYSTLLMRKTRHQFLYSLQAAQTCNDHLVHLQGKAFQTVTLETHKC